MRLAASARTPGNYEADPAEADLNLTDVPARRFNAGHLPFSDGTADGTWYVVSKGSGHSPIFAAGIWIGGEVSGGLCVAEGERGSGRVH